MRASTGDVEVDDVGAAIGIGVEDGLAQGAGARVVGVGDGEGGEYVLEPGLEFG